MSRLPNVACIFGLLIASCVARVDDEQAKMTLENPKSCCGDIRQAVKTPISKSMTFGITAKNEVTMFGDDGPSYFKLFDLGDLPPGSAICLRSHPVSNGKMWRFFYPKIAILNKDFKTIQSVSPEGITFIKGGFSEHPSMELRFALDDEKNARYMAVYTTKQIMEEGKSIEPVKPDPMAPFKTPYGPAGAVMVKVIGSMIDHPPNPLLGEAPFPGTPISGEASIDLHVLSSIDENVPVH